MENVRTCILFIVAFHLVGCWEKEMITTSASEDSDAPVLGSDAYSDTHLQNYSDTDSHTDLDTSIHFDSETDSHSGTDPHTDSEAGTDSDIDTEASCGDGYLQPWEECDSTTFCTNSCKNSFEHTFFGSFQSDDAGGGTTDREGNVYIVGKSVESWNGPAEQLPIYAHSGNSSNMVVMKLSSDGLYQWHSFFGYSSDSSVVTDEHGNVYVVATSDANWNGPFGESALNAYAENSDIVVMKLTGDGTYQWHSFFGSANNERGHDIEIEGSNIYVIGEAEESWNGPTGEAPLHPHAGIGYDMVVMKLTSDGLYQWHSFFGSTEEDNCNGVATDGSGNVYLVGGSNASWNSQMGILPLNAYTAYCDITVVKLTTDGEYQWHSFFGSTSRDFATEVSVDSGGNVYITGKSHLNWESPLGALPLHAHSGLSDIFVMKLNGVGILQWHTFFGSTYHEEGGNTATDIAVDGSENIIVVGHAPYSWDGPDWQSPLYAFAGNYDITVLQLSAEGAYQWHTFLGGPNAELSQSVSVSDSNIYVVGTSWENWTGPILEPPLIAHAGGTDITFVKFSK